MFEYKSEIFKISYKMLKASINEAELARLDELLNKRATEGWILVTYSFLGGSDFSNGILVTFKKDIS